MGSNSGQFLWSEGYELRWLLYKTLRLTLRRRLRIKMWTGPNVLAGEAVDRSFPRATAPQNCLTRPGSLSEQQLIQRAHKGNPDGTQILNKSSKEAKQRQRDLPPPSWLGLPTRAVATLPWPCGTRLKAMAFRSRKGSRPKIKGCQDCKVIDFLWFHFKPGC